MNNSQNIDLTDGSWTKNRIGMTVREEIASRVLAGMLVSGRDGEHAWQDLLGASVGYADALIEELERTKK